MPLALLIYVFLFLFFGLVGTAAKPAAVCKPWFYLFFNIRSSLLLILALEKLRKIVVVPQLMCSNMSSFLRDSWRHYFSVYGCPGSCHSCYQGCSQRGMARQVRAPLGKPPKTAKSQLCPGRQAATNGRQV